MKRLHSNSTFTNAAHNRSQAIRMAEHGFTAERIAAEFPKVFFCKDGKLGQHYDAIQPDGRKETRYSIASHIVDELIGARPSASATFPVLHGDTRPTTQSN